MGLTVGVYFKKDILILSTILLCTVGIIVVGVESQYFPNISLEFSVVSVIFWTVLCGLGILNRKENNYVRNKQFLFYIS